MKSLRILLVLLIVLLTGCQAVGGLDVNKALLGSLDVKSYEGKMNLSFDISLAPSEEQRMTADERTAYKILRNLNIEFSRVAMKDRDHVTISGTIALGEHKVPFVAVSSPDGILLNAEGMKQPLFMSAAAAQDVTDNPAAAVLQYQLGKYQELFKKGQEQAAKAISDYVVHGLPNPAVISTTQVSEAVYGETMPLTKLHAEVKGAELFDLIKTFLTNLAKDEEGMKNMLGVLYDIIVPAMKEDMTQEIGPGTDFMQTIFNDKELAVGFMRAQIKVYLNEIIKEMDADAKSHFNESIAADSNIKVDLYYDSALQARKTAIELNLLPTQKDAGTFEKFIVRYSDEKRNLNGNVELDKIQGEPLTAKEPFNAHQFVGNLKTDSFLYQLLKNDLHITRKQFKIVLDDHDAYGSLTRPYVKGEGTTMVPAYMLSSRLDAVVDWDEETGKIAFTDRINGTIVRMTVGSDKAFVNGSERKMPEAAELRKGIPFVPLAFTAKSLGATVHWDADTNSVEVIKE